MARAGGRQHLKDMKNLNDFGVSPDQFQIASERGSTLTLIRNIKIDLQAVHTNARSRMFPAHRQCRGSHPT